MLTPATSGRARPPVSSRQGGWRAVALTGKTTCALIAASSPPERFICSRGTRQPQQVAQGGGQVAGAGQTAAVRRKSLQRSRAAGNWAINSAVECHLHTVEVSGSNPLSPTIPMRPPFGNDSHVVRDRFLLLRVGRRCGASMRRQSVELSVRIGDRAVQAGGQRATGAFPGPFRHDITET